MRYKLSTALDGFKKSIVDNLKLCRFRADLKKLDLVQILFSEISTVFPFS